FWDWAEKRVEIDGLPEVLHSDEIRVRVPGEKTIPVPNPLAWMPLPSSMDDFKDRPLKLKDVAYYTKWKRTYRYAESKEVDPETNIKQLQAKVKTEARGLRSKVSLLFTASTQADSVQTWDEFSCTSTQSLRAKNFQNFGSLEGVHNNVHGILGGNGHMTDPDYAAFDPIFFLHHCNVDRLYALWEYCYPDVWMGDGYSNDNGGKNPWYQARGTYVQVYNGPLSSKTALAPFRTDKGEYWTSEQARFLDEKAKYYSYPKIAGIKVDESATPQQRIDGLLALQKYYGLDLRVENKELNFHDNPLFTLKPKTSESQLPLPGYRHFIVVVQLVEHAFNGPYSFRLYHDERPDDNIKPVLVGSVDVFARTDTSQCEGCSNRRNAGTIVRDVISLSARDVNSIIKLLPTLDDPKASQEQLVKHMKLALSAILENQSGDQMAGVGLHIKELGFNGETVPMPDHLVPVKVTLLSSAGCYSTSGGPVRF
ncbi:common central domain of tyrosinase-domain-containing protein, partial [Hysterangium stoloniferum]